MNHSIQLVMLLYLLGCSCLNTFSQSPEKHIFTLRDAIDLANTQSPDALVSKQNFRVSFWEYKSFKASYLPSLGLSGT
ncbi:MAG: hypothetical protein JXA23_01655, partial [Bacteroidales bacterium]|nr:hypothetical protein [Bacteroidales bacterium]